MYTNHCSFPEKILSHLILWLSKKEIEQRYFKIIQVLEKARSGIQDALQKEVAHNKPKDALQKEVDAHIQCLLPSLKALGP